MQEAICVFHIVLSTLNIHAFGICHIASFVHRSKNLVIYIYKNCECQKSIYQLLKQVKYTYIYIFTAPPSPPFSLLSS